MHLLSWVFASLLLCALGQELTVKPSGRWLKQATTITFKSDIKGAQFRYYSTWKVVTPRPTNTKGTLWDGTPISITRSQIITVTHYNSTWFSRTQFQSHTYLFASDLSQGPEFGYKNMDLSRAWNQLPIVSIHYPEGIPVQNNFAPTVAGSMEWIDPDRPDKRIWYFGGVKYSGNYNVFLEKKSYRLYFSTKQWGGQGKFKEDIFANYSVGSIPPDRFENVQFRSGSADSIVYLEWPGRGTGWEGSYAQLIRNQFGDDLQLQMGHWSAHGRHVHLLDNGVYYGVYHVRERVDSNYLADYVGGTPDDYEFINHCVLRDGNGTLWDRLTKSSSRYNDFKQWADVQNLCDYMLINQWNLNFDVGACWNWQGYGPYTGSIDGGFQFFGSDIDFSLVSHDGGWIGGIFVQGPGNFWANLWAERNPDFVQLFHDRLYKHFYNDGVLTPINLVATYDKLVKQIDYAIEGEVARWRQYTVNDRFTKSRWLEGANYIKTRWLNGNRQSAYFADIKGRGQFYHGEPPMFTPLQGRVAAGTTVTIANQWAGSTIYYTKDGSDPRLSGGAINTNALSGAGPITLSITESTTLTARARAANGQWSPVQRRNFYVQSDLLVTGKIQVTEIAYDQYDLNFVEFIEFKNIHNAPINLMGCWFDSERTRFEWKEKTIIQPGKFFVGTNQRLQFRRVYGKPADFFYSGNLKKSAEFKLRDAWNRTVVSVEWQDSNPWPELALLGYTLVPGYGFDPAISTKAKSGSDWRFSKFKKGSPWADDAVPVTLTSFDEGNDFIIVNEAMLNPPSKVDAWVELKNIGSSPIVLTNWNLTDNIDKLSKYRFKAGTTIQPGGFLTLDETQLGFKLDNPNLYILNGVRDYAIDFPNKALTGVSQGRYTTSDGVVHFTHLLSSSKGGNNGGPYIPEVVISAFGWGVPKLYEKFEYIKLKNIGTKKVTMTDWVVVVGSKDYKFQKKDIHEIQLQPGQSLYLLRNSTSISDFKKAFASQWLDPTSIILNPLKMSTLRDELKLQKPDKKTEVTVDRIDLRKISVPKKRQNGGPIQLTRGTSPAIFSLDPKAWTTITLPAPPPVDCTWGTWTSWSACGCVDLKQTRTRPKTPEQFGGKPCNDFASSETQSCSVGVCDCQWEAWSQWSSCDKTCGPGHKTRTRKSIPAVNGGKPCSGDAQVSSPCMTVECPVDCEFLQWGFWSECAPAPGKTCGAGTRERSRNSVPEQFGGLPCADSADEVEDCTIVCAPTQRPLPAQPAEDVSSVNSVAVIVVFAVLLAILGIVLLITIVLGIKTLLAPKGENTSGYQAY